MDRIRQPRLKKINLSLSEAKNDEIKKTCYFVQNGFSICSKIKAFFEIVFNKQYFFEKKQQIVTKEEIDSYSYFDGYWQSWRYIDEVKEIVLHEILDEDRISEHTKNLICKIANEEAVFIGVRRGDYLSKKAKKLYGSFPIDYYCNAIKIINSLVKDPVFYVFSDDIEWCKTNIKYDGSIIKYRENSDQISDFEELMLMAHCKHAIIMNSTFHWWGAYLISNKEKQIIAPKEWFINGDKIDIIPPSWIQLSRNES